MRTDRIANAMLLVAIGCTNPTAVEHIKLPDEATGRAALNGEGDVLSDQSDLRSKETIPVSGPSTDISVVVVDVAAYDEVLAKHKGKAVLVHFWATWAPPSEAQLQHTVNLGQRLKDRGFAVITVSGDWPGQKGKVLEVLKKCDATCDNLISQYGIGSETAEKFGIVGGAVPFYKLYDRAGQLRHQFGSFPEGGVEAFERIDSRVEELLATE